MASSKVLGEEKVEGNMGGNVSASVSAGGNEAGAERGKGGGEWGWGWEREWGMRINTHRRCSHNKNKKIKEKKRKEKKIAREFFFLPLVLFIQSSSSDHLFYTSFKIPRISYLRICILAYLPSLFFILRISYCIHISYSVCDYSSYLPFAIFAYLSYLIFPFFILHLPPSLLPTFYFPFFFIFHSPSPILIFRYIPPPPSNPVMIKDNKRKKIWGGFFGSLSLFNIFFPFSPCCALLYFTLLHNFMKWKYGKSFPLHRRKLSSTSSKLIYSYRKVATWGNHRKSRHFWDVPMISGRVISSDKWSLILLMALLKV